MGLIKKILKSTDPSHILFLIIVGLAIYFGSRADIIDYFSQFIQNDILGVVAFITAFTTAETL